MLFNNRIDEVSYKDDNVVSLVRKGFVFCVWFVEKSIFEYYGVSEIFVILIEKFDDEYNGSEEIIVGND